MGGPSCQWCSDRDLDTEHFGLLPGTYLPGAGPNLADCFQYDDCFAGNRVPAVVVFVKSLSCELLGNLSTSDY